MTVELPFELERTIFELSARTSVGMASGLILVARRAKAWISPVLYETVTLCERKHAVQFMSAIESRPLLASYVKTLCIYPNVGYWQAHRVLSACTTLDNLVCWISEPRLRPVLASQRLQRLSFMLSGLSYDTQDKSPDFTDPFYSQLTHLYFTDRWESWVTWTGFHLLPKITHIAFVYDNTSLSDDLKVANALRDILTCCPLLQLCVLIYIHPFSPPLHLTEDTRFEIMPLSRQVTGMLNPSMDRNCDSWTSWF